MNPYMIPTTCSVCGEKGMLHAQDIGKDWLVEVRHLDPQVCITNLKRKNLRLPQRTDFMDGDGI